MNFRNANHSTENLWNEMEKKYWFTRIKWIKFWNMPYNEKCILNMWYNTFCWETLRGCAILKNILEKAIKWKHVLSMPGYYNRLIDRIVYKCSFVLVKKTDLVNGIRVILSLQTESTIFVVFHPSFARTSVQSIASVKLYTRLISEHFNHTTTGGMVHSGKARTVY